MEEYKSNSHKSKEHADKKVDKIVTTNVKTKKKNEIRKFADIFISEDASNVKSYVIMDVLIPAVKKAISDIVTNGIDMILYGGSGSKKSSLGASKVSYRSYYDRGSDRREDRVSTGIRSRYSYDDIIIENRGEAEAVLEGLDDLIDRYKMASVADLYDLVGITGSYTDNNYGWTDIRSASVVRVRDGYMLKLPRALPLN